MTLFALPAFSQDNSIVDSLISLIENGKEDTLMAKHLNDLVWYIKFSNPDTSLKLLDESEELSKRLDFADGLGNSYNNRAIIYTVGGKYDEAVKYYKLAIEQFRSNNDPNGIGFCFSNMAVCFEYQGDYDSSLYYNKKALEIREKYDLQKGIAQSNQNIGVIYFNKGFYKIALEYYLEALEFYENKPDRSAIDRSYIGSIRNNIGNIYIELQDTSKARKYLTAAMEVYSGIADKREMAYLYTDLANAEHISENYQKAGIYYHKAIKLGEESDDKSVKLAALAGIAKNFLILKDYDSSSYYVLRGKSLASKIEEKKYLISLLINEGKILKHRKRYQDALKSLTEALTVAERSGILKQTDEALYLIAEIYLKRSDSRKAYDFLNQYINVSDSILNIEKHRLMAEMEAIYENEKNARLIAKKNAENLLLQKDNELKTLDISTKNRVLIIITTGFILVVVILILFIIQYRRKKTAYSTLYQKSMEQMKEETIRKNKENIKNGELFELIENKMISDKLYRIKDLSQETLSELLKTNRTYISKTIIDHSGKSFRDYINEYRVKEARKYLADSKKSVLYSIEAIASEVGFNSNSTFVKAFKKSTGLTPSHFRLMSKK